MCGIVGYTGSKEAAPILLEGLKKLEYRGYDSSGLAVLGDEGVKVIRSSGKLENLFLKTDNGKNIFGNTGIGHTRWATHGKPSEKNAHPHSSKRFSLVHNGIIENEEELREKYLSGEEFSSDTDTEVIVKLLQKFSDDDENVMVAIQHLTGVLEGSYALAIIDNENPDEFYAVKNKSPLLIGKGEGFNMVGSDVMAMISFTNTFYELCDKEFAVITKNGVEIYTSYSKRVEKNPFCAEIDPSDTEKGAYPHFMLKEIEEQPFVIRRIMQNYFDDDGKISIDEEILHDLNMCDKVFIIACGTSYHAGLVGKQFMEKLAGKEAECIIASEFIYNMPIMTKKPLFIFISQSGETADIRAAFVKIKELGFKSLAITNVRGSTLSREADHTLFLYAGPEIAVASTKAYTAQLAVLLIASASISEKAVDLRFELATAANVMESICSEKEHYKDISEKYLHKAQNCFYIGRSIDYYVCLEAALKLKEISYIHTEGLPAGELKHGTIALIEKGTPVIAFITAESTNLSARGNVKEVKARGANTIIISARKVSSHGDNIVISNVNELLMPIVSVLPSQYLAYYTALLKGCDIDKPRNLAKSVTVE